MTPPVVRLDLPTSDPQSHTLPTEPLHSAVPENCFYLSILNSADPDEMLPYAAFHLGLQCLPKYLFIIIQNETGQSNACFLCFQLMDEIGNFISVRSTRS